MPSFSHGFSLIDGDGQQRGGLLFCRQAKCASHKRGPELPRTTVMGRIVWPRGPNNPIRPKLPAKPPASPQRRSPPPPHFRTPSPVFTPARAFRPATLAFSSLPRSQQGAAGCRSPPRRARMAFLFNKFQEVRVPSHVGTIAGSRSL